MDPGERPDDALLDAMPVALLAVDPATHAVRFANARASALWGEVEGALLDALVREVPHLLGGGAREIAWRTTTRTDPPRPVELVARPDHGPDGERLVVVARDRSDEARRERARHEALERVVVVDRRAEANRRLLDVMNLAAHDLATPLTPMKIQIHLLQNAGLGERERRAVDVLARNVQRLSAHVADLATVCQVQAGQVRLERERVPASAWVAKGVEAVAELAKERGVRIDTRIRDEAVASVDVAKLADALARFLRHAVAATPSGTQVVLDVERVRGEVVARVFDGAPAIPAHERAGFFLPYAREHGGVDPFIAERIAALHGGRAWLEASEGRTVFCLAVPAAA